MKTVLCFGDSNTWGYDPDASFGAPFPRRHPRQVRWPGVLAAELGPEWQVIEEGQNGRTTVHDDPFALARNGRAVLPACLESHQPLDVVVLMLGTNDLKMVFNVPAGEIANGAGILAKMILQSTCSPDYAPPKLLLVAPPGIGPMAHLPELSEKFAGAEAKARRFPALYRTLAIQLGAAFVDSQAHSKPGSDGLHLDAASHATLGKAIAFAVRQM